MLCSALSFLFSLVDWDCIPVPNYLHPILVSNRLEFLLTLIRFDWTRHIGRPL